MENGHGWDAKIEKIKKEIIWKKIADCLDKIDDDDDIDGVKDSRI